MKIVEKVADLRREVAKARKSGAKIGFVPTMGYLHEGHLSLIDMAKKETDFVVVSIFVNPMQFGPGEDLDAYPRDFARDSELAKKRGCSLLFHPDAEEMYPAGFSTVVEVSGLTEVMCGKSRPGHFRGVTTIVAKLFGMVQPDMAFFGWKDAQQLIVIRRMVEDLNIPIEIKGVDTMREHDGLAMSSRNSYFDVNGRKKALALYNSLKKAANLLEKGVRERKAILDAMKTEIFNTAPDADIDYIEIADLSNLRPIREICGDMIIALAVRIDGVRLIDNFRFHLGRCRQ